jgi:hypothetical protein
MDDSLMSSAEDVILVGERCREKCVEMHTRNSAMALLGFR